MSTGANPYTLFLILVLLVLSADKNADAKLAFLRDITEKTSQSLSSVRDGVETMHAGLQQARTILVDASNKSGN